MAGNSGTAPAQTQAEIVAALRAQNAKTNSAVWNVLRSIPLFPLGGAVDLGNAVAGTLAGKGFLKPLVEKPVGGLKDLKERFKIPELAPDDTLGQVLEVAASMMSPGGAAKAIIIPATAAGLGVKELRAANSLIKAGKAEEAYKAHKIYEDPMTGELLKVIPDTKASLNAKDLVVGLGGESRGVPKPVSVYMDVKKAPVPLDQILLHPEIFVSTPGLATTTVARSVDYNGVPKYPGLNEALALLNPGNAPTRIGMGQTISDSGKNALTNFMSLLLHEVQHDVDWKHGMPSGGSPVDFIDVNRVQEAQALLAKRWASGQYATRYAQNTLNAAMDDAYNLYKNLPGEVRSSLVQRQYETGDYNTLPTVLMQQLGVDFNQMQRALTKPRVDAAPVVQNLLNLYAPRAGANP